MDATRMIGGLLVLVFGATIAMAAPDLARFVSALWAESRAGRSTGSPPNEAAYRWTLRVIGATLALGGLAVAVASRG